MKRILALLVALVAIAAQAQGTTKPAPDRREPPDPTILEGIFTCLAEGLPTGWKRTWFVIDEVGRTEDGKRHFEASFFYATRADDLTGNPLTPCGSERVLQGVSRLNAYLPEHERRWTGATFTFTSEGRYDVTYDYSVRGSVLFNKPAAGPAAESPPPPAKPTAKPAAKAPAQKPAGQGLGQGLRLP